MKRVRLLALFSVIPLGALTTAGCFEVRKGHDDNVYICACDADCPYGYSCDGWSATCVTNVQTSGSGGRATGGLGAMPAPGWRRRLGRRGRTRRDRRHGRGHGHWRRVCPADRRHRWPCRDGRRHRHRRHRRGRRLGGAGGDRSAAPAEPARSAALVEPAQSAARVATGRNVHGDQRLRRPALAAFPGPASRCHGTPALCRFSSECGAGGRCAERRSVSRDVASSD